MGRKKGTSRHSISIKGVTYDRIKGYVGKDGSISNFCEEVIAEKLGSPTDEDRKKFDECEQKRKEKEKTDEKTEEIVEEIVEEIAEEIADEIADEMDGYISPILLF